MKVGKHTQPPFLHNIEDKITPSEGGLETEEISNATEGGIRKVKRIDLEAHFTTKEIVQALYKRKDYPRYADDPGTKNRRLWYTADTGEPIGDPLLNKLLDLEETQSVVREDLFNDEKREVAEVFMVDGVELVLRHQLQQVGKFHRDHAARLQQ